MKNKYNKLTCLFGHHDYSKRLTEDKEGHSVHLCKICKRGGYREYFGGLKMWFDYDEEGNIIHIKCSTGQETWYAYDGAGREIYFKRHDGVEEWKNNYGHWKTRKPKNWKYEKEI